MKKLIYLSIIATFISTTFYARYDATSRLYPQSFEVVAIDKEADTITLIDNTGNLWDWEGVEDWQKGDKASAIMDNNDTPTIYDDKIVKLHFAG